MSFLAATPDGRLAALSLLISRDFQSELICSQRLILGRLELATLAVTGVA